MVDCKPINFDSDKQLITHNPPTDNFSLFYYRIVNTTQQVIIVTNVQLVTMVMLPGEPEMTVSRVPVHLQRLQISKSLFHQMGWHIRKLHLLHKHKNINFFNFSC